MTHITLCSSLNQLKMKLWNTENVKNYSFPKYLKKRTVHFSHRYWRWMKSFKFVCLKYEFKTVKEWTSQFSINWFCKENFFILVTDYWSLFSSFNYGTVWHKLLCGLKSWGVNPHMEQFFLSFRENCSVSCFKRALQT